MSRETRDTFGFWLLRTVEPENVAVPTALRLDAAEKRRSKEQPMKLGVGPATHASVTPLRVVFQTTAVAALAPLDGARGAPSLSKGSRAVRTAPSSGVVPISSAARLILALSRPGEPASAH